MADLTFDSNQSSVLLQSNLKRTVDSLSVSRQRLSSGLRINNASDDPAGLMLAEGLRTDVRVFTQAIKNVSDGMGLVGVADSAAQELSSILTRLKELSLQAANSQTSTSTRTSLHTEAVALASEYDRIVSETDFNSKKLLDGSLRDFVIQAGYGAPAEIKFSLGQNLAELSTTVTTEGGTEADGTFKNGVTYSVFTGGLAGEHTIADFNGDGYQDILFAKSQSSGTAYSVLLLGNGNGTFLTPATVGTHKGFTSFTDVISLDTNGDGYQDYITASTTSSVVFLGNGNGTFLAGVSYSSSSTIGDFSYADVNGDSKQDLIIAPTGKAPVVTLLGNGNGTFLASTSFAGGFASEAITSSDLNGDGYADIVFAATAQNSAYVLLGNGNNTFKAGVTYAGAGDGTLYGLDIGDVNGDGKQDLVTSSTSTGGVAIIGVTLGNGNGTFNAPVTYISYDAGAAGSYGLVLEDFDGDSKLDIAAIFIDETTAPYVSILLNNGNGTFKAGTAYGYGSITTTNLTTTLVTGDLNGDGVSDIVGAVNKKVSVFLGNSSTSPGGTTTGYINLLTQNDALTSAAIVDNALSALALEFGAIAGTDARLSSALTHLSKTRDELSLGRDKIMDVDAAEEIANYLSKQIIQKSGVAILAQANLTPKLALSLLEDL